MIRSMTGFGRAQVEEGGLAVRAEMRSVNHRHLQVKARLPGELAYLEPAVEALVRKGLERGAVTLSVAVTRGPAAGAAALDVELARRYQRSLARLARELGIDARVDLALLVGLPGVLGAADDEQERGREEKLVLRAVRRALDALVEMRAHEGASLAKDLRANARAVGRIAARIRRRMPAVVREHHASLVRRLNELLDGRSSVQPADLPRELALLAERVDVGEELARLASHLDQVERLLAAGGGVGRKLDFLAQELFREANTIGAKCNDAAVSHAVVDLKTHIERLREQVQNLE
jgi:uncharacterized protein (TIGR00255 family)